MMEVLVFHSSQTFGNQSGEHVFKVLHLQLRTELVCSRVSLAAVKRPHHLFHLRETHLLASLGNGRSYNHTVNQT